ncbi:MAG: Molybdopterin-synthase adenylyltransferase [Candidatus Omnitrophica bacterium ADurb.Bin314]|jgi:sulfur carrier protein ThiS adenylyltransferase|nr:MAG: Molybdopterin-synthase adenylyltransferase [Candidatus Omnitrophica bacterium ADurb.Bin314]
MNPEAFERDLIAKLGAEGFRRVRAAKIGIAGAGGLGSNCATALVRSGFRDLVIADFDVIDDTNLDRQAYFAEQVGRPKVEALAENLHRTLPGLTLHALVLKLDRSNLPSVFAECDAVVECFDQADAKSMFVETLLPTGKFLVTASGLGGIGASDEIRIHRIRENLVMIGDLRSDIRRTPALAPRVAIAAAKQADVVLEYVVKGMGGNAAAG